jgi:hypothetical protein
MAERILELQAARQVRGSTSYDVSSPPLGEVGWTEASGRRSRGVVVDPLPMTARSERPRQLLTHCAWGHGERRQLPRRRNYSST